MQLTWLSQYPAPLLSQVSDSTGRTWLQNWVQHQWFYKSKSILHLVLVLQYRLTQMTDWLGWVRYKGTMPQKLGNWILEFQWVFFEVILRFWNNVNFVFPSTTPQFVPLWSWIKIFTLSMSAQHRQGSAYADNENGDGDIMVIIMRMLVMMMTVI